MNDCRWLFAYGSLIWRPDFDYRTRRAGFIRHYRRRFWQASVDHRGTAQNPGRVVTLVHEPDEVCWGVAFELGGEALERVLAELDHRERGGYRRIRVDFFPAGESLSVGAIAYHAGPDNPQYVGPESLESIARRVCHAIGPSGSNRDYVLELANTLHALQLPDAHVQALAERIRELSRDLCSDSVDSGPMRPSAEKG